MSLQRAMERKKQYQDNLSKTDTGQSPKTEPVFCIYPATRPEQVIPFKFFTLENPYFYYVDGQYMGWVR